MKHFISLQDYSNEEIIDLLNLADKLKKQTKSGISHHLLKNKTLGMIFVKSSTRTRVSFEVGMYQLGGHALFLSSNDIQIGRGETIADTARVMSRYLDGIMIRTFDHQDATDLARFGSVPVINGLTDLLHPCQALTDLMTIREHKGVLKNLKMTYLGDGNNMAHSLLIAASKTGMNITIATPKGYECDQKIINMARKNAIESNCKIFITNNPAIAISNADVVYTDTWVSMGQEKEKTEKILKFTPYQVNTKLMNLAKPDAIFMHCLPAYRGLEVTEEVLESPSSIVFDEAENRLHAQKAVLVSLLAPDAIV